MTLRNIHAHLVVTLFALMGCSSVPKDASPAKAALLAEPPAEYSAAIEKGFRKRVTLLQDAEINNYLIRIAGRLFNPGKYRITIEIVNTQSTGYQPNVWVIPGGKIFVDIRILKKMQFENELAAALAFGWERSEDIKFRERMIYEVGSVDPDPANLWLFENSEDQVAVERAVERIYKAGYDPRGLVNYFDRLAPNNNANLNSQQYSLKDKARRTIAFYAPLLNPIVRTEEFYKMRKRISRL